MTSLTIILAAWIGFVLAIIAAGILAVVFERRLGRMIDRILGDTNQSELEKELVAFEREWVDYVNDLPGQR